MNVEVNYLDGRVAVFDKVKNFHFYENPMETRVIIIDDKVIQLSFSPSNIESINFISEDFDE